MVDLTKTPDNLPIPQDDGAARHLVGMTLPRLSLLATNGKQIDLGSFKDFLVIYCYPMTDSPMWLCLTDGIRSLELGVVPHITVRSEITTRR